MRNENHNQLNLDLYLDRLSLVPWFIASTLFGALTMFVIMSFL